MDLAVDRRARALLVLLAAGCVYEWNGDQPAFPLSGDAPSLSSFQKLNTAAAGRASLMTGPDGATWAAFCEFWSMGSPNAARNCKRMHLVRLAEPAADEVIAADGFALHDTELYAWTDDTMAKTRTLILHHPGDATADDALFTLPLPSGRALIYTNDGGNPDVFMYLAEDSATTSYDVYRRDRKFQLTLPLPAGSDASKVGAPTSADVSSALLFTADGNTLVVYDDTNGDMTAWSTLDGSSVDLGMQQPPVAIDDARGAVLTVAVNGLRSVPLDGRPARTLSTAALFELVLNGDVADYTDAAGLWQVPLDGSAAPSLLQAGAVRLRALGPRDQIVYSRDPAGRYSGGAGDGWLGDWRFMERGRLVQFSSDSARIRFLEHAATLGTYGDLTSVTVPNGAPNTLGINVHSFTELPDHRVLAVENAVYAGTWNRLVVIDESAHTKHWVVPSVADFLLLPSGQEIIADVVSGASGFDILRVPAPR